jgi:iron-sulfur cluster insertion protein
MEHTLNLTESAIARIAYMRGKENNPKLMLRLAVNSGGCSGFSYEFSFDDQITADDKVFAENGIGLIVDEVSLGLLEGAEIDYVDELVGSSFQVKNPNASSGCGCGMSFSI